MAANIKKDQSTDIQNDVVGYTVAPELDTRLKTPWHNISDMNWAKHPTLEEVQSNPQTNKILFPVYTSPLSFDTPMGLRVDVPGQKSIYTLDPDNQDINVLSIASDSYTPVTNLECLELAYRVLEEHGTGMIASIGTLDSKKQFFCTLDLNMGMSYGTTDDPIANYLLIANSFNQTIPVTYLLTPTRVECQNMLYRALNSVTKKHTANVLSETSVAEIRATLGLIKKRAEEFGTLYESMTAVQVSDSDAEAYFNRLLGISSEVDDKQNGARNIRARMKELSHTGMVQNLPENSVARVYNAAVEYYDYHSELRKRTDADADKRAFAKKLNGTLAKKKEVAFNEAMLLVKTS